MSLTYKEDRVGKEPGVGFRIRIITIVGHAHARAPVVVTRVLPSDTFVFREIIYAFIASIGERNSCVVSLFYEFFFGFFFLLLY